MCKKYICKTTLYKKYIYIHVNKEQIKNNTGYSVKCGFTVQRKNLHLEYKTYQRSLAQRGTAFNKSTKENL